LANEVKEVLHMTFMDDGGKNRTMRVPDPRGDLTAAEILAAMEVLIETDILPWFGPRPKTAKVVETHTELFDITID